MVIFGDEIAMNQTCYALASKFGCNFALHCQCRSAIPNLVLQAHGSVFDTITTTTFQNGRFLLAPQRLLEDFEKVVEPLFLRLRSFGYENQSLTSIRDALLPKLISGEIRVNA